MMYPWLVALLSLFACVILAGAGEGWQPARPDFPWSFPADHWSHPDFKTEWWYFTGHLQDRDDPSRRFGYQFTFFRIGLTPGTPPFASQWSTGQLIMGHASISVLGENSSPEGGHLFSEVLYRDIPLLAGFGVYPDSVIAWSRAPAGTDGRWEVTWTGNGFAFQMRDQARQMAFSLTVRPRKPLVLQGPNGFSAKGDGPTAASQYYSFTRLATTGSLTVRGQSHAVTGESWMDREFGSNQLDPDQVGWDWLSLQLADGREVMTYLLRNRDGRAGKARATVISAAGEPRYLRAQDWRLEPTGTWTSETTGTEYPILWRLAIPTEDLDLNIEAILPAQENVSVLGGLHYWEGAVAARPAGAGARAKAVGRGYVELTGYGEGNRPPI